MVSVRTRKRPAAQDDNATATKDNNKPAPKKPRKGKAADAGATASPPEPTDNPSNPDQEPSEATEGPSKATASPSKAQYASSGNLVVPVDEHCQLGGYKVYIGDDGIIYDANLNQTHSGANNNKFYRVQLLTDGKEFRTYTRWGRVGERGQNAVLGSGALDDAFKNFDKKFKDKSGLKWADRNEDPKAGKYVFVERSYEDDSDAEGSASAKANETKEKAEPPKCMLVPQVESLMQLIFNKDFVANSMRQLRYDANKLPLGKLSNTTISRGYQALKNLSNLFHNPNGAQAEYGMRFTAAYEMLSDRYHSVIPHAFGRDRPPALTSHADVIRELELLDSLSSLKESENILKSGKVESMHPLDAQFKGLGLQEMTPIDHTADEFKLISSYLIGSRAAQHGLNYNVVDIFRIERMGEKDRFGQSKFASIASDRRLLWHGSRATNFGGILSQGLRIAPPEAPHAGYMFGKGIYLADMSSKSANYCASFLSGGEALLLLCEAELGAPMQELTRANYNAGNDAAGKGLHSTWGQGSQGPSKWVDAACIHATLAGVKIPDLSIETGPTGADGATLFFNEYICYDIAQVQLRYLLRVKM